MISNDGFDKNKVSLYFNSKYSENNEINVVSACLDLIEEVFKFIDESVENIKKYEGFAFINQ